MKKKISGTDKLGDIPAVCAYCAAASPLHSDEQMLCRKRGIVAAGGGCKQFRYDPLKRVPSLPPQLILPEPEEITVN